MGRHRIFDKPMTNAEKQKRYRDVLAAKREAEENHYRLIAGENIKLRHENDRLHSNGYIPTEKTREDTDYENLKKENERLKKEVRNRNIENEDLVLEIKELKEELKKKDKGSDVFERAQARSTSGAWKR